MNTRLNGAGRRRLARAALAILAAMQALILAGCQPARPVAPGWDVGRVLRINLQGELAYAPLLLMQRHQLLERRVPGLAVEWKAIPSTEAIDAALMSGGLDIATGSLASFLLARQRGLPVRLLAAVSEVPAALVATRPDVRRLASLRWGDQVVVATPGGQEHALVRMAALRELGDWSALDPLVTSWPQQEPVRVLLERRSVAAVLLSSPQLEEALARPSVHRLVEGADAAAGRLTTVVAYSTPALRERQEALFRVVFEEIGRAQALATEQPELVVQILAEFDGREEAVRGVRRALSRPELRFVQEVRGLDRLSAAMRLAGQVGGGESQSDLVFEDGPLGLLERYGDTEPPELIGSRGIPILAEPGGAWNARPAPPGAPIGRRPDGRGS